MNYRLQHTWFDNTICFQQSFRSFSMERDVARQDNQTSLPSTSVSFHFVPHLRGGGGV